MRPSSQNRIRLLVAAGMATTVAAGLLHYVSPDDIGALLRSHFGGGAVVSSGAEAVPATTIIAPARTPDTEVLWLAEDNRIRRATVDAGRHALFAATAGASIAEDGRRLKAALGPRLRAELDAVLLPVEARTSVLTEDVFSFGTGYDLAMRGLTLAASDPGADARPLEARVRAGLNAYVLDAYRDRVVRPQTVLPRVRAAVAIAFADTRRDLLRDCDKYDIAFQDFLAREARRVEVLTAGGGWSADDGWTRVNATFRSLCHTAHLADTAMGVIDAATYDEIAAGQGMAAVAGRLTDAIAGAVIDAHGTAEAISDALAGIGIPRDWTSVPAAMLATVHNAPTLYERIAARFDEPANRPDFEAAARRTVKDGRARFEAKVNAALRRFIDLEMEGIAARLSLPVDDEEFAKSGQGLGAKEVAPMRSP